MDQLIQSILLIALLFLFLGGGFWVAMSLLAIGYVGISMFASAPPGIVMSTTVWGASASWTLTALPLFIWMGEILFRTKLSEDMFQGLAPWLTRLPGRLLHVNVLGCAVFAAVSGSSAATAMTVGKMSVPELSRRGYDEKLSIGSLAGSGTLGLLIPPSIILIVYGVSAEVSIVQLFIAGVFPGMLLAGLFMGYIALWAVIHPGKTPPADFSMGFLEKVYASRRLIPIILLIVFVIGSIYWGWATATEAAACGVAGALFLSLVTGSLNWQAFWSSLLGATRTSCMIAFILAGAAFLSVAMGYTGLPRVLAEWIRDMQLSPYVLLIALTLFFIVLGCFLDGISVVVLTVAIILPMVQAAGIDLLWFGIYVVLVVEMSQITPPVGFNLFVLQGLTGRNILYIAYAALPFFLLMVAAVVIITIFPEIVTYLPQQATARN
ncbi:MULTISPECIES: TRAP transporter large permease [Oceanibaculum]|uniref:TRAP transporter large permease protein n=1 Tax=Oceanibaculum indicum TaxID=526216 RepID=A0A420WHI4_9PROT|nr:MULTISPECIES: TRAP transporter large permease subunit [Oceanibaculum]MCH2393907.1 TRAP transporter large permease subunit [Oceanibaculum sp.]RKQ70470.1 tripartite ATP-independent transporter DctM subunit [Oceanibaculum indicum]